MTLASMPTAVPVCVCCERALGLYTCSAKHSTSFTIILGHHFKGHPTGLMCPGTLVCTADGCTMLTQCVQPLM